MKFLAFGDLEGDTSTIECLLKLPLKKYDFLLYLGDMADPSVFKELRQTKLSQEGTTPPEALKKAAQEVIDVSQLLQKSPIPVYGILGNADLQYYSNFVDWPFVQLHNKIIKIGDFSFVGYNGRPLYKFEKENRNENGFSEKEIYSDLSKLLKKVDAEKTILITHAPPYQILDKVKKEMLNYAINTYGKRASKGNIGSTGLKQTVGEFKPKLHLFSHIHESEGIVQNKNTLFVNIGSTNENKTFYSFTLKNNQTTIQPVK